MPEQAFVTITNAAVTDARAWFLGYSKFKRSFWLFCDSARSIWSRVSNSKPQAVTPPTNQPDTFRYAENGGSL